jgi:hypothetical protein
MAEKGPNFFELSLSHKILEIKKTKKLNELPDFTMRKESLCTSINSASIQKNFSVDLAENICQQLATLGI